MKNNNSDGWSFKIRQPLEIFNYVNVLSILLEFQNGKCWFRQGKILF